MYKKPFIPGRDYAKSILKPLFRHLAVLALLGATAGPRTVQAAATEAYAWKHEAIYGGGFVTGIVPHPNFPNVIYCQTDTGGAYRWNDANTSWEPIMDWFVGNMGTEAIALDPTDANIVYLSVGEANSSSGARAILVSANKGATWTTYTPPFGIGANNDGRSNGPRMMVDPNNPSILFYATHSGLYKSTNRGQTWAIVSGFPVTTTANGVGPNFVQFIQTSGASGSATPTIFVGISRTNSISLSQNNLYCTTNGGSAWFAVDTSLAGATRMPQRVAQDGLGNMYITFSDGPGPNGINNGAVLKLNLSTLATTVVTPPLGQGGFAGVSVSRQNPNQVAVSTMDRWWPQDVIYLSTNGGTNWTDNSSSATLDFSSAPWLSSGNMGHWTGDCQIDPFNTNRLWYITGAGVMGTTNLLASSGRVYRAMQTGIEEMGAGNIYSPSSGPQLYSFFWDIGGFAQYNMDVSPPGTNYFNPVGTSNVSGDCADASPWIVARVAYSLSNYGAYSTDYGRTWTQFSSCPSTVAVNGPGVIAVSAKGTNLVWTPYNDNQWYSANKGATWTPVTGGTSNSYGYPAVADRVSDATFYIYDAANGRCLRSSDGGQTFSIVNSSMVKGGNPPATVFGRAGDLWIPCASGLYHSTDYGATWTQLLAGQDVTTIGFGKAASGASYPAIYIWAQLSGNSTHDVYRSNDAGTNWTRINDDQHRWGSVSQLRGDQRTYGLVYAGCRNYGNVYGVPAANMPINGIYTVVNRNSGQALDNPGSSMVDGTRMDQSMANGGGNQQWMLENLGNGIVRFVNAYSGQALTVSGSSTSDGAPVIQSAWVNGNHQIWTLTPTDSGYYEIANVNSGKALEVPGASTTPGTLLDQLAWNGGTHQQWGFACAPPTGLTAAPGNAQVTLSWTASSGAASYNVKRSTVSGGPYTTLTNVTTTSYTDTGLAVGMTYCYVVSALTAAGVESGNSTQVAIAVPSSLPLINPSFETNTSGAVITTKTQTGFDASGNDLAGWRNAGSTYVNSGVDYAGDSGNIAHNGSVIVFCDQGDSGAYQIVNYQIQAGDVITLTWWAKSTYGNAAQNVKLLSAAGLGTAYSLLTQLTNSTAALNQTGNSGAFSQYTLTYTAATADAGRYLAVSFVSPGTQGAWATLDDFNLTLLSIPAVPGGLTATGGVGQVSLTWSPASRATGYYVKQSTVSGGPYSVIATNSGVSFISTGLSNGIVYDYVVSAFNSVGESGNSAEAYARPVSASSTTINFVVNGGNILQLTWPVDHTGWQLQAQTNAPGVGIGTNWVTVTGSTGTNQMFLPVDSGNGCVFYRLKSP